MPIAAIRSLCFRASRSSNSFLRSAAAVSYCYLFGETGTVKLGGTSCNNTDVLDFADEAEDDKGKAGLQKATSIVYGNGHTSLFADKLETIRDNRKPYVDAVAGRNVLEVVLAIYKSQLTGLPVKMLLKDFASVEMTGMFGEGSL